MSTNHLPLEPPLAWSWQLPAETGMIFAQHHYHPHQRPPPPHLPPEGMNCEREHLFEKPLTPSDVGKLNRLVIPKQHAERCFPLDGNSGEKGLLLSFEDEAGKPWRFRYSYWTSSQSYVLTKGWSRFVKEKRLDAGDVVLFERRRSGGERLYIGWKRRFAHDDGAAAPAANAPTGAQISPTYNYAAGPPPFSSNPYDAYSYVNHDSGEQDAGLQAQNPTRAPPAVGTHSKRLRLFGVNLDCGPEQESPEPHRSRSGGGTCTEAGDHCRIRFTPGGGRFY